MTTGNKLTLMQQRTEQVTRLPTGHNGGSMTALRRTVRISGAPMKALDLQTICDKCDRSRAHGNHIKCSKLRQAEAAVRRAREKE